MTDMIRACATPSIKPKVVRMAVPDRTSPAIPAPTNGGRGTASGVRPTSIQLDTSTLSQNRLHGASTYAHASRRRRESSL